MVTSKKDKEAKIFVERLLGQNEIRLLSRTIEDLYEEMIKVMNSGDRRDFIIDSHQLSILAKDTNFIPNSSFSYPTSNFVGKMFGRGLIWNRNIY